MGGIPVEVELNLRAQHAEGPLWDADIARLCWVDIMGERVHCFDPESATTAPGAQAGQVRRYRPDGALDGSITLQTMNPTSVTFGGDDGGDLYITSSWSDVEPASRADQPLAGAIFRARPGVAGRPSPRFADLPTDLGNHLNAAPPGKGDNT
jgi:sugar lactone lactonase YvrE